MADLNKPMLDRGSIKPGGKNTWAKVKNAVSNWTSARNPDLKMIALAATLGLPGGGTISKIPYAGKVLGPLSSALSTTMKVGGPISGVGSALTQYGLDTLKTAAAPSKDSKTGTAPFYIGGFPTKYDNENPVMQYEKLIPTFGMTARIPTDGGMSVVPKTNKKSPQAPDWRGGGVKTGPSTATKLDNLFANNTATPLASTASGVSTYALSGSKINNVLNSIKSTAVEPQTRYQTLEKPYVGLE